MRRQDHESAADWHARALRDFQAARADEERHRRRLQALQRVGLTSPLDHAYMDAVDRAELAQFEVLEAERAVERERLTQEERQLTSIVHGHDGSGCVVCR